MKAVASMICLVGLVVLIPSRATGNTITIQSLPSIGPNNSLSPSWSQYEANALASIAQGGGSAGNRSSDPTAYAITTGLIPGDLILSSFISWEGVANPGDPFAGEYGNQLLFGLQILGNGDYFRLSNLYNTMSSSDLGDALGGNSGGFSAYGPSLVGIDCGADGLCGTTDDFTYKNGEDASLRVNELFYVGVGAAFDATNEPGTTHQDRLGSVGGFILSNSPFSVSNSYMLYADDAATILASSTSTLSTPIAAEVPEPISLVMLITGLGVGYLLKRHCSAQSMLVSSSG